MEAIKKHFHIIVIALFVLLIAPIAYYFLYALPAYNQSVLDFETQKYEDQKAADEEAATQAFLEENLRVSNLDICLEEASQNYVNNWATACNTVASSNEADLNYCLDNVTNYITEEDCRNWHQVDWSTDCSLPSANANNVNDYYSDAKDDCYRQYGN